MRNLDDGIGWVDVTDEWVEVSETWVHAHVPIRTREGTRCGACKCMWGCCPHNPEPNPCHLHARWPIAS